MDVLVLGGLLGQRAGANGWWQQDWWRMLVVLGHGRGSALAMVLTGGSSCAMWWCWQLWGCKEEEKWCFACFVFLCGICLIMIIIEFWLIMVELPKHMDEFFKDKVPFSKQYQCKS